MKTENLSTLKIHKLSKEQYDRELAAGRIDETAIYLTSDDTTDPDQFATDEDVATAVAAIDISSHVNTHSTDASAHQDIRNAINSVSSEITTLKSSVEFLRFTYDDGTQVTKAVYVG